MNNEATKLSIPSAGKTVHSNIKSWRQPLKKIYRNLVSLLKDKVGKSLCLEYYKSNYINLRLENDKIFQICASSLILKWFTNKFIVGGNISLVEAERWFSQGNVILSENIGKEKDNIVSSLQELSYGHSFVDALPYICEVFVIDEEFLPDQKKRKRIDGVFYTPSDVSDYIIDETWKGFEESLSLNLSVWLDPACGTGVFLRSIFYYVCHNCELNKEDALDFLCNRIFGVDINIVALHSATYCLLMSYLSLYKVDLSILPKVVQNIQRNLVVYDSTKVKNLNQFHIVKCSFPRYFDCVVSNPPYTRINGSFTYLKFVKMMMMSRSSGMVVPLSITYNSNKEFRDLRSSMRGKWLFANFDRTPDSLFGDNTKIRCTIAFFQNSEENNLFFTTNLKRWSSRNRSKIFENISFTVVKKNVPVDFIPKLGCSFAVEIFENVYSKSRRLSDFLKPTRSLSKESMLLRNCRTAYNWLPFELSTDINDRYQYWRTESQEDLLMIFSIVCSRFSYWLWRVLGDGFHLTNKFILSLPYPKLSKKSKRDLSLLGLSLWDEMKTRGKVSKNSGVETISYDPYSASHILDKIDVLLGELYRIENASTFVKEVQKKCIVAGRECEVGLNSSLERWENKGVGMAKKLATENKNYVITKDVKEKSIVTKEEWREYTKTVWQIANVTNSNHPAVFPVEIPKRLIKLFTFWGETVLDPFSGIGTTAFACLDCERKSICVEQNSEYISAMEKNLDTLFDQDADSVNVVCGDSRNLNFLENNSVHLVVTSPPYWDKADYGKSKKNIGDIGGYIDFFRQMEKVLRECYRVLVPGRKICLVTANVNQQTNHGLLSFPLSTDLINILRDIGFVMVNEIIWNKDGTGGKWGSHGSQRPIFGSYPYPPNFLFKNVHEYILIFSKPASKPKKGQKVKIYEDLMELPESLHYQNFGKEK